jgi:outer membrane protein OmpA-like peptidoglycan-associated protein
MNTNLKSILLGAACAAAFGSAALACNMNVDNNNVVRDIRGNQVTDVRGNCVFTKWKDGSDKCNTTKPVHHDGGLTLNERTVYFGFDSATLTPESVYKLNRLLGNLEASGKKWNTTIVGHADKMGDASYNQSLSARRANAVRNYLTSHGKKVVISSVSAEGKNDPVTEGCDNAGARASTINCLQPDRRVEIRLTPAM